MKYLTVTLLNENLTVSRDKIVLRVIDVREFGTIPTYNLNKGSWILLKDGRKLLVKETITELTTMLENT